MRSLLISFSHALCCHGVVAVVMVVLLLSLLVVVVVVVVVFFVLYLGSVPWLAQETIPTILDTTPSTNYHSKQDISCRYFHAVQCHLHHHSRLPIVY